MTVGVFALNHNGFNSEDNRRGRELTDDVNRCSLIMIEKR